MGMMDRLIGIGGPATVIGTAAVNMAEIFRENATRSMELDHAAYARAMAELQAEFATAPKTLWDSAINGLNRLPRVLLTFGTMGLFGYAMVEPAGFSVRMDGMAMVPEPLWWLMGAIVSFYFGAPVAQHCFGRHGGARPRTASPNAAPPAVPTAPSGTVPQVAAIVIPDDAFADNAALAEWAAERRAWQD